MIIIWLIGFIIAVPTLVKVAASELGLPFNDNFDYVMASFVALLLAFIWPITLVLGTIAYTIKRTVERTK